MRRASNWSKIHKYRGKQCTTHYTDVIMLAIASQITSLTIVYSIVYSDADQRKHQSSASLAFVRGIHRGPVNSPHKWPVTRKMFPFDDVIMGNSSLAPYSLIISVVLWYQPGGSFAAVSLPFIPAWISNHLSNKVPNEITYPFPNLNGSPDSWEIFLMKAESEFYHFHSRKCIWNCHLPTWRPFCPGEEEIKFLIEGTPLMYRSPVIWKISRGTISSWRKTTGLFTTPRRCVYN